MHKKQEPRFGTETGFFVLKKLVQSLSSKFQVSGFKFQVSS